MQKKRMSILFYDEAVKQDDESFGEFISRMREHYIQKINAKHTILVHPD